VLRVTLALGVCSAVAAHLQPMEKRHANVHLCAPMNGLDNSLSAHGPEKPGSTEVKDTLSVLKASFGIKDTNSPMRLVHRLLSWIQCWSLCWA
jgi:hypothetical protein